MPLNEFCLFLIYICQLLHTEYKAIVSINAWKIVFLWQSSPLQPNGAWQTQNDSDAAKIAEAQHYQHDNEKKKTHHETFKRMFQIGSN